MPRIPTSFELEDLYSRRWIRISNSFHDVHSWA
jgi:hypothetical protein